MNAAQIAVAALTGVFVVTGATLLVVSERTGPIITGTVLVVFAMIGYIMLLGMIASDRRTP